MTGALLGAVSQGILWGIMVLGVYITYKLLDIADLTVDGSFALGGSVCAVLVVAGVDPVIAIIAAMVAGVLAGAVTGFLHTVFEIPAILAGILTQIALWSVNLRIMGKSNTPLLQSDTIFSRMTEMTGLSTNAASIFVGLIAAVLIIAALYWFFGTEIGSALRATGNNEDMIRALGVSTAKTKMIALMLSNALVGLSGGLICQSQKYADIGMGTGAIVIGALGVSTAKTKMIALMLSNALVGLSGGLICQSQKYADIGMGTGAIVIGLAAIVIGEVLGRLTPGKLTGFKSRLVSAVAGSVVYFLIRAIVLQLGMDANDMKLLSAVIVALALCIPVVWEKFKLRTSYTKGGEADA